MSDPHLHASELTPAQWAALRHIAAMARLQQAHAAQRLSAIVEKAECAEGMLEEAIQAICGHARVAVHFHPDRFGHQRIPVVRSLLDNGYFRNQFETGLSSGSRTAFPGGARDLWETRLFGGAYHSPKVTAEERPKYGALALVHHPDGPSPRFGSCYFILKAHVSRRCSFTFAGSEQDSAPQRVGTLESLDSVMAALLSEVESGQGAAVPWPPFAAPTLGIENLTVSELLDFLCHRLPLPPPDPASGPPGRALDSCVEAQIHGPIDLRRDVERLVIDPSFNGTPTGEALAELCDRYGITKQWHCGFQLSVDEMPDNFRGPAMPLLARRIAGSGVLDAAVIGEAEGTVHEHPESWTDWGSPEETLQHLKQLWHVLVHIGKPLQ